MLKRLLSFTCIGICVFLLTGCGGTANQVITVDFASARIDIFKDGYATVGVIQPQVQVDVVSKYSGTVLQTFKEAGDLVKKGDVLLQLDSAPVMNQIKSARASLDQANAAVAQANTGVEQAEAGIERANKGVDQAGAGLENALIGLKITESGSTQQTLIQYQTSLNNAKISYDSTQLELRQAKINYDNTESLYDIGAVSKSALDDVQLVLDRIEAAAASAKAALDAAQKNLDIYTEIISEQNVANAKSNVKTAQAGVGSAVSAVDGATAALHSAEAAVESAKAAVNTSMIQIENLESQLRDYSVASPIDGIILNKIAVAGGMAGQSPVYTVADIDKVIIKTAVPKKEINKLSLGGNVQVFYPDNTSAQTQITAISNSANSANLYMVQVIVDNKENCFIPGMTAKIVFIESEYMSLVVPFTSVVSSGKDNYIFVEENGMAKKIPVKVLGKNSDEISIETIGSILSEGAQIVTYNAHMLKDGDPIKKAG